MQHYPCPCPPTSRIEDRMSLDKPRPASEPDVRSPRPRWTPQESERIRMIPAGPAERARRRTAGRPRWPTGSPSIREILAGYDSTVVEIIDELDSARTGTERVQAAQTLVAAVSIHDSVLAGVLCTLLDSLVGGPPLAARLRDGCGDRAKLIQAWTTLISTTPAADRYQQNASRIEDIIEPLIESFREHQRIETSDVTALLEQLPGMLKKSGGLRGEIKPTASAYGLSAWPNPEPAVLAAHMALWGRSAPTRIHPWQTRHPRNRVIRSFYHSLDRIHDWHQSHSR